MKKIAVLTATRAEFGLLSPVIKKLKKENDIKTSVIVTGMHLSPEFGLTYKEIEADGIRINKKIEILLSSDTAVSVSKSMGLAMINFAEYFNEANPDALLVLGDRYEALAVCCAAMNAQIPIFHLYGGETTEGAVDEAIRHSITKMSYLHFTSTSTYRRRVIQLGEDPGRVFNVGSLGVENVLTVPLLSRQDLLNSIGFALDGPYAVVTFHPVTLESGGAEKQCRELLKVLEKRIDLKFIITKANADAEGRIINQMLDEYVHKHGEQAAIFDSLGMQGYLSAVRGARFVLGNSSSGIVETPSFHVPTVNIGHRQTGRIQAGSIVNCQPVFEEIMKAIESVTTAEFQKSLSQIKNPYEGTDTSGQIVRTIMAHLTGRRLDLRKKFYDL